MSGGSHYTTGQLAGLFGMSANATRILVQRGVIHSFRIPGSRHRRIPRQSVLDYIATLDPETSTWMTARLKWLDAAIAGRARRQPITPTPTEHVP